MTSFPRGSEWRRWDLHVHSPHSILSNAFGDDFDAYASQLLRSAVENRIAAVGITDYFTIEGYKALRALIDDRERLDQLLGEEVAAAARQILVLPNVELRLRELVTGRSDGRVNFHVLFSDALTAQEIEEDFLHRLRFTHESRPDREDDQRNLTVRNLAELGSTLRAGHEPFRDRSDLMIGAINAVVSHEDVTRLLTSQAARFRNRYLLVLPADEDLSNVSWDGQGHQVRKVLVQKSHFFFSSNASTRDFGLGRQHESRAAFEREFGAPKACVHGSDAHTPADLFEPAGQRYCWIKADPTFDGLRQLLFEPDTRVFIGTEPPALDRVRRSAARLIDSTSLSAVGEPSASDRWFASNIEWNSGLVAVIGRKGSGKSALADIMGLLGDAANHRDFSFLTPRRFLSPRKRLGRAFTATVTWRSGESVTKALDAAVDESMPARVSYLPQSYLERICTELESADGLTPFDEELESVIFSHVSEAARLGCGSLGELIEHRAGANEAKVKTLRESLHEVNEKVVALRAQLAGKNRANLQAQLAQRRRDLDSHDAAKPAQVPPPAELHTSEPSRAAADTLTGMVGQIKQLDAALDEAEASRKHEHRRHAAALRLMDRIENLQRDVERFGSASSEDEQLLQVSVESLVRLEVDQEPILQARDDAARRIQELDGALDRARDGSLAFRRAALSQQASELRKQLDEPARRYEEYQRQLSVWERERSKIVGSSEEAGTIAGLEGAVADLERSVPEALEAARDQRVQLWQAILAAKVELLNEYERLHAPVRHHVDSHPVAQEVRALSFSTVMAVDGLIDGLLAFIHQGRRGSFQGEAEGRALLRRMVSEAGFQTPEDVDRFLSRVGDALTHDVRDEARPSSDLVRQLKQGKSPVDLYDFLFGLSYLRPRFELRWQGKPLDELSPGERGTLLLVFFLLIDQRQEPLVLDQPEENLDNETIAELLVPAVKYAKGRRQVVLVTHNPNLAVVCDADQIIHAAMDKSAGNVITYETGSIENAAITKRLIDVLEGTKPAFDLRDAKYEILDRSPDVSA